MNLIGKIGLWLHVTAKALGRLHEIQNMGFDYVIVKISDGPRAYFPAARKKLCADAATIKLGVVAWAYVYPTNIAATITTIVANLPTSCTDLVLDAELEWEQAGNAAALADQLCHGIAEATGHKVALHLSGLYAPDLHPKFPYAAFLAHCVSFMPQSYAEGSTPVSLVAQRTDDQAKPLAAKALGKCIIPTTNTPGMMTALTRRGYRSQNVWLWDGVWLPAGKSRPEGEDMGVMDYTADWTPALAAARGR